MASKSQSFLSFPFKFAAPRAAGSAVLSLWRASWLHFSLFPIDDVDDDIFSVQRPKKDLERARIFCLVPFPQLRFGPSRIEVQPRLPWPIPST